MGARNINKYNARRVPFEYLQIDLNKKGKAWMNG